MFPFAFESHATDGRVRLPGRAYLPFWTRHESAVCPADYANNMVCLSKLDLELVTLGAAGLLLALPTKILSIIIRPPDLAGNAPS
jgi:hypothetical protein